jgi:ADP-ribose pyrophosphatase
MSDSLSIPKVKNSQMIFEESLIKIQRDELSSSEHSSYQYYSLIVKPFAVNILAQTVEGLYILTQEYRHPTKHFILGCPGGYIDNQETPLDAAKRELLEESGYITDHFEIIGTSYPCPGITGQKTYYIHALGARLVTRPQLEPSEIIQICLMSEESLKQRIQQGAEVDGNLCTALLFKQWHLK